jgi:hypothetical protein
VDTHDVPDGRAQRRDNKPRRPGAAPSGKAAIRAARTQGIDRDPPGSLTHTGRPCCPHAPPASELSTG